MSSQSQFSQLGLSQSLLQAIDKQGYKQASPIQKKAIPLILKQKDLMAAAQTGTGKTAAFTLPVIQLLSAGKSARANQARCLILTPTRELAAQVADNVAKYAEFTNIKSTVVFGGVKINPQMQKLRGGVDILIATPGRLLDLYQQNAVKFDQLELFILDEADRMLDMGFIRDIRKIAALMPKHKQSLLFSATFTPEIRQLAKTFTHNASEISVDPENSRAETIQQILHVVDQGDKASVLIRLIKQNNWQQVLVFTRTKHGANRLSKKLDQAGIKSAAIHGNKSQGARTRALAEFKANELQVLVATDIAARGLDIAQLPHVINFELPHVAQDYVHRIGRTGRAGAKGHAVSLVCFDELKQLQGIESLIGELIERVKLDDYQAKKDLPLLKLKPFKAPRPKKKRPAQRTN
ncbi:DEAD/DEAH box helicase [Gayadomonas joobiniege]|uniref:DEAD/DEAH box helicase n=1 Tax=Gayadomonas joobiniege TaxID=1234606 RepID=UPI0003702C04|nr:DEAD/DEAH box helicase [Gayadomonas joobiniege]